MMCFMYCELGFARDENGCEICKCLTFPDDICKVRKLKFLKQCAPAKCVMCKAKSQIAIRPGWATLAICNLCPMQLEVTVRPVIYDHSMVPVILLVKDRCS